MAQEHGADLTITVFNEDNGRKITITAGPGTPIKTVIARTYDELKVPRQADDRLRCEANGQDVFQFSELHLSQYITAGHCPALVWLFAGGTGGA